MPLARPRPRVLRRGVNKLAELETLCALGGGSFEVGVHHAANLFREGPLARRSGAEVPDPFADRIDKRQWAARIYEEDAFLLDRMGGGLSLGLTHILGVAWPHVAPYRDRIAARLDALPDDGLARARMVRGDVPRWTPPPRRGAQEHFVVVREDAA